MKVAFTGTFCTGKTTLFTSLQDKYKNTTIEFVEEAARKALELGLPLGTYAGLDTYVFCIKEQLKQLKHTLLICDRSLLDTYSHFISLDDISKEKFPIYWEEMLYNLFALECSLMDCYFYFPIEFPLIRDEARPDGELHRITIDKSIRDTLDSFGVRYIVMEGTHANRMAIAKKYMEDILGSQIVQNAI